MNLSGVNLNLLPILNALLQEKSVTRTAIKLHIPQPNVSRTLQTLREALDDALLVKGKSANELELTPKAQEIAPLVNQMIQRMKSIFMSPEDSNPENMKHTFKIAMNEMVANCITQHLSATLDTKAPGINMAIITLNDFYMARLNETEDIDLAIVSSRIAPPTFKSEILASSKYVCVIGKGNKEFAKQKPVMEILKEFSHILTVQGKFGSAMNDWHILYKKLMPLIPDIEFVEIPYLETAIKLMLKGNYLSLVPEIIAKKFSTFTDITIIEIPLKLPLASFRMIWPEYRDSDNAHKWLRKEIKNLFLELKQL